MIVMKAIILAAGRGSRMGTLTREQPKCLTLLGGKSLLQWQVEAILSAGIDEIGVVRGYLAHKIDREGIKTFDNNRWSETNMVTSLICAKEWLEKNTCIISYSDIVYPVATIRALLKASGDIVVSYNTEWFSLWQERFEDPLSDLESFKINEKGILLDIGERAKTFDDIQGQYMGLIKLTPLGWKSVEESLDKLSAAEIDKLDMTSMLKKLLMHNVTVNTAPINGKWYEVDSSHDLIVYNQFIRNNNFL